MHAADLGQGPLFVPFRSLSAGTKNAVLLPDGSVVYYWEEQRAATESEKAERAAWFDKEWEAFRDRARKAGLPAIERSSENVARALEKERAAQPLLMRQTFAFLSASARGIPLLAQEAMRVGYPLARRHFIEQPVVTAAGLRRWDPMRDGHARERIRFDLARTYGEKTWMRIPLEALHLRGSPDGRLLALETIETTIVMLDLTRGALPISRLVGHSPLGWSPDGRWFYVTRDEGGNKVVAVYEASSLRPVAICPAGFDRRLWGAGNVSSIRALAAHDGLLAIALSSDLGLCQMSDGSLYQPSVVRMREIGPPRAVVFSQDGRILYVASARGFQLLEPLTFRLIDQYLRPAAATFDFQMLAGVSPDGRYAAVLHGRERLHGHATLVIWDIRERRVVQRIGDVPFGHLRTISSGFRHVYPPVSFSSDRKQVLIVREDGVLDFYVTKYRTRAACGLHTNDRSHACKHDVIEAESR